MFRKLNTFFAAFALLYAQLHAQTIKLGSGDIEAVYVGSTAAEAVYLGSQLVWSAQVGGNVLMDEIRSYWDFTEASGGRFDHWWRYHFDEIGTVGQSADGAEFDGTGTNRLERWFRDVGAETTGTLSGFVTVRLDSIATSAYLIGKDGNKASEYGWRVFYDQPNDCFTVNFWDNVALVDRSVSAGSGITTSTIYRVYYGYDATAGELWASVNGGTVQTASYTLSQGSNNGYIGVGNRPDYVGFPQWPLDGAVGKSALWNRRITVSEIALIQSGLDFSEWQHTTPPTYGFAWDFEAIDSYSGVLSQGPDAAPEYLNATDAHTGTNSAEIAAVAYSQAQIYNYTIRDLIASTDEGRVVVWCKLASFVDGAMLIMLDGKSTPGEPLLDTNNSYAVYLASGGGFSGVRVAGGGHDLSSDSYNIPINQWFEIDLRYNRLATGNKIELRIDGNLVASTALALTAYPDYTWSHMSLGNDTDIPIGFRLDDLQVTSESLLP